MRLGVEVAFAGAVGDDPAGAAIREGLEMEGVDVSDLAVLPGARSPQSSILVTGADRAIVHYAGTAPLDPFEFVRTIAAARIAMPKSYVRLSAGRQELCEGIQALCFFAGANSIFYGDKLLTTGNPEAAADRGLMVRLGIGPQTMDTLGRRT